MFENIYGMQKQHISEVVTQKCSMKKMFWNILKNLQEAFTMESFLSKVTALQLFCNIYLLNIWEWLLLT